jgi:hypothetical protein
LARQPSRSANIAIIQARHVVEATLANVVEPCVERVLNAAIRLAPQDDGLEGELRRIQTDRWLTAIVDNHGRELNALIRE